MARAVVIDLESFGFDDDVLIAVVMQGNISGALDHIRLRLDPVSRFFGLFALYRNLPLGTKAKSLIVDELQNAEGFIHDPVRRILALSLLGLIMLQLQDRRAIDTFATAIAAARVERLPPSIALVLVKVLCVADRLDEALEIAYAISEESLTEKVFALSVCAASL